MPDTQLYRYMQLRHALTAYRQQMENLAESNPLEAKLLNGAMGKGGISRIYRSLVVNSPECFSTLLEKWEELVGRLEEKDWRDEIGRRRVGKECRL